MRRYFDKAGIERFPDNPHPDCNDNCHTCYPTKQDIQKTKAWSKLQLAKFEANEKLRKIVGSKL